MRMRRHLTVGAGLAAAALALAACGGGSSPTSSNSSGGNGTTGSSSSAPQKSGGTLKVLVGTFPDSLDPQFGYTTQAIEGDNMVYTPMLTYAFKEGTAGTQLQPGLATALPVASNGGKTYTMTMRSGITYSNGTPVKASDFKFAIERAIKISWGGSSFFSTNIVGAADYQSGKAKDISGIVTDDSTGKITVNLTNAYGAFANLLAFPASAPIPSTTPMKVLSNTPPVGVGPYKFGKIVPNGSYQLLKNPTFAGFKIPNIPTGFVDEVDVEQQSNNTTAAQQVLNGQADVFDPADTIPSGVLPQVESQAKGRYTKESLASTYYFFVNTKVAPFNNAAARQAVNMAIDRTALARLSSGSNTPGCFFLPPGMVGHPSTQCTSGDPNVVPSSQTIAKAKQMIKDAGLAGSSVTVWSETRSPRQEFMEYYTGLLKTLGFNAKLKVIQDSVYFQTIGNQSLYPQTGFADWSQDFPNPADFYLLLSKAGIQKTNSENFGNVDDPTIESSLAKLEAIPATQLQSSASGWQNLDEYVNKQGFAIVFGYATAPKFLSARVDYASAVFHNVNYLEFSTVSFNS